jgi:hypothetical protein
LESYERDSLFYCKGRSNVSAAAVDAAAVDAAAVNAYCILIGIKERGRTLELRIAMNQIKITRLLLKKTRLIGYEPSPIQTMANPMELICVKQPIMV